MKCNRIRRKLGAYLDGELPERKAEKIRKHLAECSSCTWELKSFHKIDELGRWTAEAESAQPPEDYWENYQANLHARLEQEKVHRGAGISSFLSRCWNFSLAFAVYWSGKMAPGLAAAVVILALAMGLYYVRHQPIQTIAQGSPETEKISVNLYLKEHENAVMLASHSTQPQQMGVELGYEDVFYYDAARGLDSGWSGERGVFLRAPRHSSYPVDMEPSKSVDIANGDKLSLKAAQEAVSFRIVAPQILHPAYLLECIRKVEGREAVQLVYTNGISTLSLFEQALESEEKLYSSDFREYVMYSKAEGEPANMIGWNSREVSFTLIGEQEFSPLMGLTRAIQESYFGEKEK